VSLVIGPEEFGFDAIFAKREIEGVRGYFAGEVAPQLSNWDLADDPVDGPSVEVTVAKQPTPAYTTMWHAFLEGEEPQHTVQFTGLCEATAARFRQYVDSFEIEFDVPSSTRPDDVAVDVSATQWTLAVRSLATSKTGHFRGRVLPDDTNWLLDDLSPSSPDYHHHRHHRGSDTDDDEVPMKTLYITLRKEAATDGQKANWWPGLSDPPP